MAETPVDPYSIGEQHELQAGRKTRQARGAWYTPRALVKRLVSVALEDFSFDGQLIVDPTCGGGAFLLAAAEDLVSKGVDPATALSHLRGMDIDSGAVAACIEALTLWADRQGISANDLASQIVVGDALTDEPPEWKQQRIVVGNPPFGTPLKSNSSSAANSFRADRAHLFGPYADRSALHLQNMIEGSADGSLVLMVMPISVLATSHLSNFRSALTNNHHVKSMWVHDQPMFQASVRTCALVIHIGERLNGIGLFGGEDVAHVASKDNRRSWPQLACDALKVPEVELPVNGATLSALCDATAGFRDEYYGLADVCMEPLGTEEFGSLKLATSGNIALMASNWGKADTKFAKKVYAQPVIPQQVDSEKVQAWIDRQRCPKVLLPTQSKVLKPFFDREGEFVASTPVIVITGDGLDSVAAMLLSPVLSLYAYRTYFGAALSTQAIKLSAKAVLELPQPEDRSAWEMGAKLVRDLDDGTPQPQELIAIAEVMNGAYGGNQETMNWWLKRSGIE